MDFEGPEKKVELCIDPSLPSFRQRGHEAWSRVCTAAGAAIVSRIENERCTAYLLSESSLFVFDHKLIMITCGRTHLVNAIFACLEGVPEDRLHLLIYERKNEIFPEQQPTSFREDARSLSRRLPGRAFRFGDEDEHHVHLFHLDRPQTGEAQDTTVEILMHGIDDEVRRRFSTLASGPTEVIRRETGVDRILDGFAADDYAFRPSGYSLNAIRDEHYWTVHVTPQEHGSYVSFETNALPPGGIEPLAGRVLGIFRPRAFDLMWFDRERQDEPRIEGYRPRRQVVERLTCGYDVRFSSYFLPQQAPRRPVELSLSGSTSDALPVTRLERNPAR